MYNIIHKYLKYLKFLITKTFIIDKTFILCYPLLQYQNAIKMIISCISIINLLFLLYLQFSFAQSPLSYIFIDKWENSFAGPIDIAVDPSGKYVYVADGGNSLIKKFDANGFDKDALYLMSWGSFGTGPNQLRNPSGVAVDPSGKYVYVADTENDRIQKFDSDNGIVILSWGATCHLENGQGCIDPDGPAGPLTLGDGQLYFPTGIYIDKSRYVYVADTYNDRIQKFDNNGTFITKWGYSGTENGNFSLPADIAVDPSGKYVYVADTYNDRIQKFDNNGTFITKWGYSGTENGNFSLPMGLAIDPSGKYVYVADTENDRIQKFDNNGTFITSLGSTCYLKFSSGCTDPDGPAGPLTLGDGQFGGVTGISFDPSGTFLYAIDSGNNRAEVFSLPPMINISFAYYDRNPMDPLQAGPRWGIDKVELVGNSTYSASSYSVKIDWGDGNSSSTIPLTSLTGIWGYDNKVEHIYNATAISTNPQKVIAKLVNSDGIVKASTFQKPLFFEVSKHNVYLHYPFNDYSVPWNGTAIFPINIYDFENESPVKGRTISFSGQGAVGVVDRLTDDNGRVIGRGQAPGELGNWNVRIQFNGEPEYKSAIVPITFETTKHQTSLDFSISPTQLAPSETYDIEGILVDATTGKGLGSKKISIVNQTGSAINVTTDANGIFLVRDLIVPPHPTTVFLMAIFNDEDLYFGKASEVHRLNVQ